MGSASTGQVLAEALGLALPGSALTSEPLTYVLSLSMPDPVVRQQQLAVLKKQVELGKDPNRLPTAAATDLPLNVPAAYWLDLNAYRPEKVAQTLKQPMLFLQGEGDYQVTREDFQIWQDALGERSDMQFIMYPGLSHLFMPIEGGQKATPATYTVAGHVAEEVVNEIGSWIKRISRLPRHKLNSRGEKMVGAWEHSIRHERDRLRR
jgi:fermentation-respiration switch protein FrsA (DUF1100 family)